eukprot:g19135.t1
MSTNYDAISSMFAGACAGALSKTAVAPFERVKILNQNGKAQGFVAPTKKIYAEEGLLAFWKGNNANVIRVVPNRAILFWSNDQFKMLVRRYLPEWEKAPIISILRGSCSGAIAVVSSYPLDVARTRMGALYGKTKYSKSVTQALRVTVQEEGLRGLFRGVGPTVFGSFPYEGIKFGVYELLMGYAPQQSHLGYALFCGGLAGGIGGTLTYPIDTVRRRMQMQGTEAGRTLYKTSWACFVGMIRHEGVHSLFAGVVANLYRVTPSAGIQFAAYQGISSLCRTLYADSDRSR